MSRLLRTLTPTAVAVVVAVTPMLLLAQAPATPEPSVHAAASMPGLLPGDIVRLRIWREPDLSGEFPVDESGTVVFPKLGPLKVESESPQELTAALVSRYSRYLKDPSIEITLLRRVNVLGAVVHPGVFPIDPTMTVSDVLALAGGATPDGDRYRADLLRDGKRLPIELASSDRVADLPIRSGDQLFVPERSWASRNQAIIAATISASVSLLIVLLRR